MTNKVRSASKIESKIYLELTEEEARALTVLPSYGKDTFIKFFYQHLGKHYLQPHEKGLRSLFDTIDKELPQHLRKIDEARKVFDEKK